MTDVDLDEIDRSILRELQTDGRISNLDLSRRVDLSPPATHARVRRLERTGIVRGYVGIVDRELAGFDLLCFVSVAMQVHQAEHIDRFRARIQEMPEVLECHHLTGEYDYLLKVALRNRRDLERFAMERLTPIPGVGRIHTSLVLAEVKATTELPIERTSTREGARRRLR
jgi:Lrp/AsnC family transcriptional regulator, leucine-responsive regulatory protein